VTIQPFGKMRDGLLSTLHLIDGPMESPNHHLCGTLVSLTVQIAMQIGRCCTGYDSLDEYVTNTIGGSGFFGAIIGRYANRIARGSFNLNGKRIRCPRR